MAVNDQYRQGQTPFGMDAAIGGTGAPGTTGISPEDSAGAVIGEAQLRSPWQSSQTPADTVRVRAGDTAAASADSPVPTEGDPMTGIPAADLLSTGSGEGSAGQHDHPNSMWRRP